MRTSEERQGRKGERKTDHERLTRLMLKNRWRTAVRRKRGK